MQMPAQPISSHPTNIKTRTTWMIDDRAKVIMLANVYLFDSQYCIAVID